MALRGSGKSESGVVEDGDQFVCPRLPLVEGAEQQFTLHVDGTLEGGRGAAQHLHLIALDIELQSDPTSSGRSNSEIASSARFRSISSVPEYAASG